MIPYSERHRPFAHESNLAIYQPYMVRKSLWARLMGWIRQGKFNG